MIDPVVSSSDKPTSIAPLTPTATTVLDIEQGLVLNDDDVHAADSVAPVLAGSGGKRALIGNDVRGDALSGCTVLFARATAKGD